MHETGTKLFRNPVDFVAEPSTNPSGNSLDRPVITSRGYRGEGFSGEGVAGSISRLESMRGARYADAVFLREVRVQELCNSDGSAATEHQRSTCRRTPSPRYSGGVRSSRRSDQPAALVRPR